MQLSAEQLKAFDELGYLVMPGCFSEEEVAVLRSVSNHITRFTRPEWIAHRDFAPIVPCEDDALLELARQGRRAA